MVVLFPLIYSLAHSDMLLVRYLNTLLCGINPE